VPKPNLDTAPKVSPSIPNVKASPQQTFNPDVTVLTGSLPGSRINLRENPSANSRLIGYGLVGDKVEILEYTDRWYRVRFPGSGAIGWISAEFVGTDEAPESPSPVEFPTPEESPTPQIRVPLREPVTGSCQCPYDLTSNGRECGGRSAYSKPGGEEPKCYIGE
jgi:hypothetical protein